MSWGDPEEPGQEILEREPGRLPALLTRLERLTRRAGPGGPGRRGPHGWGRRGWLAALIVVALLATGGVMLARSGHRSPGVGLVAGTARGSAGVVRATISAPDPSVSIVPLTCGELTGAAASQPTVLGVIQLPGSSGQRPQRVRAGGWRYRLQTALLVRGASPPITVSVPGAWRTLIGLSPADGAITDHFVIPSCQNRQAWNYVLVGVYLRAPTACAPLEIQAGGRSATARLGLGQRCPGGQ
jgi:hypothetical protein